MIRSFVISITAASLALGFAVAPAAAAMPTGGLGGQIRAESGGKTIEFPSLKTDITVDIAGDLAAVTVEQTFINPTDGPLNATYLFPLNEHAAVHAMEMRVGNEMVVAEIQRREAARQTFEHAKREGKAAALLEQHRPNMFTQNVANLMPGEPIKVTLKYVHPVPRVDGAYELVVPLVVGPRYIPRETPLLTARRIADADAVRPEPEPPAPMGTWSFGPVPQYPDVAGLTIPKTIDADRVSIRVNLQAGVPIAAVASSTHAVTVTGEERSRTLTLAEGRIVDNRDFVATYRLAGHGVQAGVMAHRESGEGTLALTIEPPAQIDAGDVTPREIVFVLDTSGSMSGFPIEASKKFMRHALAALRPSDYFRIVRFSNNAREFSSTPLRATPENLAQGRRFVEHLSADGGTEVVPALRLAFGMRQTPGTHRLIVFLSDGYVGNEAEILQMVAANIGEARTYVLGVGTAVNRYLLAEMAHQGRGLARIVDPTDAKVDETAVAFAAKLSTTAMTDLAIDWGDLKVADVVPAALPDLFAGDAIRIHARFRASGPFTVKVKGRINGRQAALPVQIDLPAGSTGEQTRAIPIAWARAEIGEQMRHLMMPQHMRPGRRSEADIEQRVTTLGLSHSLATQWTSFVAVSKRIVNTDPAASKNAQVPLPMVDGVGPKAYGQPDAHPQGQPALGVPTGGSHFGGGFSGGSTPEPEHLIGLLIVVLISFASYAARLPR
ncbi:MAG: VIT and vWA domain-containing protein [Hyphomicrobiaceae bacterium]